MLKMKMIPKLAAAVLALGLVVGSAHARSFEFSYLFSDSTFVTGTLEGTENGLFVDNVTNVTVNFNGDAQPGTVFTSMFDGVALVNGAVVSFDVQQNNFFFSNVDLAVATVADVNDWVFAISNAPDYASALTVKLDSGPFALDGLDNPGVWSLTAVPDQGSTVALFAFGLVGLGCLRRRVTTQS